MRGDAPITDNDLSDIWVPADVEIGDTLSRDRMVDLNERMVGWDYRYVSKGPLDDPRVEALRNAITVAGEAQSIGASTEISADLVAQSPYLKIVEPVAAEAEASLTENFTAAADPAPMTPDPQATPAPVDAAPVIVEEPAEEPMPSSGSSFRAPGDVVSVPEDPGLILDLPEESSITEIMRQEAIDVPTQQYMTSQPMLGETQLYEAARHVFYTLQADGAMRDDAFARFDEIAEVFDVLDGDGDEYVDILNEARDILYDENGDYRSDVDWNKLGELGAQLDQDFASRIQAAVNPAAANQVAPQEVVEPREPAAPPPQP